MFGIETALFLRLAVATLLGAAIGVERSIAGKQAGMRTYALVSLGSALFTLVGALASYQFSSFASVNPLHLAGFVAVGIGFIGAGLAGFRHENNHAELTTASGIWLVAGVGMACGFGYYSLAVVSSVLGVIIFSLFAKLERSISVRFGTRHEG